jgi:hypothetical protein
LNFLVKKLMLFIKTEIREFHLIRRRSLKNSQSL